MGTWKLEVFKMAMYMTFPVACFHYFNQPEYFEEWVTKTRRDIYPPDDHQDTIELRQAIKNIQKEQELQMLKSLQEKENTL